MMKLMKEMVGIVRIDENGDGARMMRVLLAFMTADKAGLLVLTLRFGVFLGLTHWSV